VGLRVAVLFAAGGQPSALAARATGYPSQPFDLGMANARAKGWRIYEVGCGHDVMLDMPERLADILQEELSRRAP
jgi:hypothetical protein